MDETVRNIIIECRQSIRSAAFEFDLCHQTLNRHVQNAMKGSQVNVGSTGIGTITIYLESFRMYFGLNPMIIRELSYQCVAAAYIDWHAGQLPQREKCWLRLFFLIHEQAFCIGNSETRSN